jgi:hypothetical protein
MIISQAIDLLQNAELKQLKVGEDKIAVRGYINSAILEIYKRFNLWEAEAVITIAEGVDTYDLVQGASNVVIDLSISELLMVERIFNTTDEDEHVLLTTNDHMAASDSETVVFLPRYNKVKFKTIPTALDTILVVYKAAPIFLTHEKADIPLPPQFNEALFHYVGYRAHGSVKGDVKSENNTHYIRFEASCDRIKKEGLFIQDDLISYKFQNRGFV